MDNLNRRIEAMDLVDAENGNLEKENSKDDTDSKFFLPGRKDKKPVARMSVDADSEIYKMNHKERGKAIIFNHKNFKAPNLSVRNGTDEDRDRLEKTLLDLKFNVKIYNDPTRRTVRDVIEALAKEDHSDRDCVLVAVFSHGDRNRLHAYDDDYKPDTLWDGFDSNLCKSLAGKPKIFLVQACQGDSLDGGTTMKLQSRTMVDSAPSRREYTIPNKADFIMVYSTFPGYYSWRNTTSGSWFIQALCEVLSKYSSKRDFLSMLTICARHVALNFESYAPDSPSMHGKKQIPLITSTLIREIYFDSLKTKHD